MNYKLILRMLGRTLLIEAAALLLPLLVSLYYKETPLPFVYTILLLCIVGSPLAFIRSKTQFYAQEGFVIVAAIWLLFCVFGSLPFLFCGYFGSWSNCLFEVTSGFTTTGASILTNVEILPKGILFWRAFDSWMGGMGVLLFTLAILPNTGERTHNLVWAESPGPVKSKLVPKTAQSSKILYSFYIALTVLEILCLRLVGMPWFDSTVHTFATVCTGGFSIKNASIGAYGSPAVEIIITIFMLLSSLNFAVFFLLITKRFMAVLKSDELRYFLGIVAIATGLITINLVLVPSNIETGGLGETLRHAFFQVATIISTTGFSSVDFNLWPVFSQIILVSLMVIGGCAGSTAGGIKVSRFLLLIRHIRRDVRKLSHPRAVKVVKLDGNSVDESTLERVSTFFACYVFIFTLTCLIVSLDNFSFTTTITAVVASIGNVGPGLDMVGPMGNFSAFSDLSKIVLTLCMLIGRLEIFPILILLTPSTWKRLEF
jgi:trk system potassium uptake protein TrkH